MRSRPLGSSWDVNASSDRLERGIQVDAPTPGRFALSAAILLALIAGGSWWTADRMSADVADASQAALAGQGLSDVSVTFDGRDVTVQSVPSRISDNEVRSVLESVTGVRQVSFEQASDPTGTDSIGDISAASGSSAATTTGGADDTTSGGTADTAGEPSDGEITAAQETSVLPGAANMQPSILPVPTVQVHFPTGESVVEQDQLPEVDIVANYLLATPEATVVIGGHTDSSGREAVNQFLSEERARAVATLLEERGVDASRVTVVGHADTRGVGDNNTDAGRDENRRVEFSFG